MSKVAEVTFPPLPSKASRPTRFSDPGGMQSWANLVGWYTEMVYSPEEDHPSKY